MDPKFLYIIAGLIFTFFGALVYRLKGVVAAPVVQVDNEDAPATSSSKTVAIAFWIGNALALVLPWFDTVTDVSFNVEMQNYLDKQSQFDCDMFNQEGMFDSSGFSVDGKKYPSASEYENFNEYVQKILVYFPVTSLEVQLQASNARCLTANLPSPLPPDCEYNAAEYACVRVAAWVKPNQVFR